ncbi:MAG: hypothetical protein JW891_17300 [Candidatus Lokiarchaeota archaeon]|nr:hypothetical protein [Candidatus Lokiarchaeota archaeon]
MSTIFIIKSDTINLEKYTIKDLPGSSGRLDVIARCVLAALIRDDSFIEDTQIWTFLGNYGAFIFDTNKLDYQTFPKNELKLAKAMVELIQRNSPDSLRNVPIKIATIIDIINELMQKKYTIYILEERGKDFLRELQFIPSIKRAFVIGNQSGDFVSSEEICRFNLSNLSFGPKSYLASSIIRLIQIYLERKK